MNDELKYTRLGNRWKTLYKLDNEEHMSEFIDICRDNVSVIDILNTIGEDFEYIEWIISNKLCKGDYYGNISVQILINFIHVRELPLKTFEDERYNACRQAYLMGKRTAAAKDGNGKVRRL